MERIGIVKIAGERIPVFEREYRMWRGHGQDDFAAWWGWYARGDGSSPGKPVVDVDAVPLFPELALVALHRAEGWDGCWVDGYGPRSIGMPKRLLLYGVPRCGLPPRVTPGAPPADAYKGWRQSVPRLEPSTLPDHVRELFMNIRRRVPTPLDEDPAGGCWDALLWRGNQVRFLESKWGDGSVESQHAWFVAARSAGVRPDAFAFVRGRPDPLWRDDVLATIGVCLPPHRSQLIVELDR